MSYRRNAYDGKAVYVAHISLVKGVPFYGYHVGYKYFLKIYMLNPLNMTRLADLLYQKAIMERIIQPYESHLQYILQWMCDYNLYGCAYIDCTEVQFRAPVPEYSQLGDFTHRWHDRSIPPDWISNPDSFPRRSHCAIEVDIHVRNIANRREIQEMPLHHDFVERLYTMAPDEKLVHSLASLWRDETKRRKKRMGMLDPSSSPFLPEELISMSANPRELSQSGWIHEEEFKTLIEDLVEDEKSAANDEKVTFETFVKPAALEDHVRTAMQSVEDLFPEQLLRQGLDRRADSLAHDAVSEEIYHASEADFDDIAQADYHDFPTGSDDDMTAELENTGVNGRASTGKHRPNQTAEAAFIQKDQLSPRNDNVHEPQREKETTTNAGSESHFESSVLSRKRSANDMSSSDNFNQRPTASNGASGGTVYSFDTSFGPDRALKRQKLEETEHTRRQPQSSFDRAAHPPTPVATSTETSQTTGDNKAKNYNGSQENSSFGLSNLSQASQKSIKAQGANKAGGLSFTVVKDPHDPDTSLRLSQRSDGLAYHDSSQSTITKKHAQAQHSFDSSKNPLEPFKVFLRIC